MAKNSKQSWLPGMDDAEEQRADPPSSAAVTSTQESAKSSRQQETKSQPQDGPVDLAGKRVYVVDAPGLIFQSFHAITEMTSPAGEPTNAIFGFTRDLLTLLKDHQPDYLIVTFDESGPTFRDEIYEEYKAHREEPPGDLMLQMQSIMELLDAMNILVLTEAGFEADDIMATIARQVDEQGGECILVSTDKDCRQLITDHVKIYNMRKNQMFAAKELEEDWGIRPDQAADFQALVGDSVDNVPGVPLIGPKMARELLQKYDHLENVLAHAEEVSGKKRKQNLIDFADQARLSRQLVELNSHVPVEFEWHEAEVGPPDLPQVIDIFTRYDFRRFREQFEALQPPPPMEEWESKYHLVNTPEKLQQFLADLKQQQEFSLDTETTSLQARAAELVGLAVAWKLEEAYYLAVRAPQGEACLDEQTLCEALRPLLEDPQIGKIGQNLKYDMVVLRRCGVELKGLSFDTMLASYLLEAGERTHNLDELARKHLRYETMKIAELIGSGKSQKPMSEVPLKEITHYAAEDAEVPLRLLPVLEEALEEQDLDELLQTLELPLVEVLAEMEYNGIKVDPARLAELSQQYGEKMEQLKEDIYELAGREFNIDSPKQLQEILFDELKLRVVKRSKTGRSTDASVLAELAKEHELPAKIMDYRQYAKLKNTYVDALPELILPQTQRVHASFNQHITATGRLSSSDPNLQNIPIRTEQGREIRSAFVPGEPDWLLLAADYSQIELRILAHFCEDEVLCRAFAENQDIHTLVASQVHGVPMEEVTSSMRREAKAVNFGIIYGQSPFGLAKSLGIDKQAAETFIDEYFARYPKVEEFLAKILEQARENGYVKTILGRRRKIEGVRRKPRRQRNLPERTAINTVIQGSAADLIKKAMIAIHHRLRRESDARMLLQIHDELVFEVPPKQKDDVTRLVVDEMTSVLPLQVPLKVDVAVGPNWFDVEEIDV